MKNFTDAAFESEVLQSKKPVVVDFWAEWCGPCRMLNPIMEKITETNKKVLVGKLDVDANPKTTTKYGIQGIPTIIFFKEGKVVHQITGHQSQDKIQKIIDEVSA